MILVLSGPYEKVSLLDCELWWHWLGVISSLMWLTKWVQSIECEGDECFICTLLSLAWWQTFLFFLGTCLMVFKNGLQPFRGSINILRVLGHSNLLGFVFKLSYLLENSLIVLLEVCYSSVGLFLFIPVLDFSSSHN